MPTLMIRSAPNAVHSRRIVRRVAVTAFMRPSWPYRGSARRAGVGVRHEHFFHQVQLLENDAAATDYAGERVVGNVDGHLSGFGDGLVQAHHQRPASCEDDTLI